MAITASAQKAIRSSARKRAFNLKRRQAVKAAAKELQKLAAAGRPAEAEKLLPRAYQAIDKALKRGIIKPNAAARQKSRLARLFNKTLPTKTH